MNILLQTRCGCLKGAQLEATVAPTNIVIELPTNEQIGINGDTGEKLTRKFTYLGTNQGDNKPIYMESIEQDGYQIPQPLATIGEAIEQSEEEE